MARHEFESKLALSWPPEVWSDVTVVVAVSGGPDSVALARGLAAIRQPGLGRLVAAHFNHRLRGAESDADEAYCLALSGDLGWICEVGRASGPTECPVLGTGYDKAGLATIPAEAARVAAAEESTRRERHEFLQTVAGRVGARYVLTAHTADDQVETILHRIVRGTGLGGLAGIPRVRPLGQDIVLVRPLLGVRRSEVLDYLETIGQRFRTDATNRDPRYTRNRIRHELLPQLAERYNPSVVEALLRLGTQAGEAQAIIEGLAQDLAERSVAGRDATHVTLDCRRLAGEPRHVVRETFVHLWRQQGWPEQAMGFDQWDLLAELGLAGDEAQHVLPGNILVQRRRELLCLQCRT